MGSGRTVFRTEVKEGATPLGVDIHQVVAASGEEVGYSGASRLNRSAPGLGAALRVGCLRARAFWIAETLAPDHRPKSCPGVVGSGPCKLSSFLSATFTAWGTFHWSGSNSPRRLWGWLLMRSKMSRR